MLSTLIDKNTQAYRIYDQVLLWVLLAFFAAHMANHMAIYTGADSHIAVMDFLRIAYRNPIIELILLWAIVRQTLAGFRQAKRFGLRKPKGPLRVLVWTGVYLILFLAIHLSAIAMGRYGLNLDTNIYFGASGFRAMPAALFFYPYYFLAVFCAFAHLGGVLWLRSRAQSPQKAERYYRYSLVSGLAFATLTIVGISGQWQAFPIPDEYMVLY